MKKALTKQPTTPPKVKAAVSTAIVIASIEKKAKPAFNALQKIKKIKTQQDFDLAASQVKFLKELVKVAEKEEGEMINPIKESIKQSKKSMEKITEHFQPFKTKVSDTETEIKLMMSTWLARNNKLIGKVNNNFEKGGMSVATYAKKIAGLQVSKGAAKVRKLKRLEIYDASKIPREYLFPNENAIEAALVNNIKVPGCRMVEVDNIAI